MKFIKIFLLAFLAYLPSAWATELNMKYSSNYMMPAYIRFKDDGVQYSIRANINVPLYKIQFISSGTQAGNQFYMLNYKDVRNGKTYSQATIQQQKHIEYGKLKDGLKTEELKLPTFDLFTMAFQLTYYEKLPRNFQITNGKKLYPMENVVVNKSEKTVKHNKQNVKEITYQFSTGDKDIVVKKFEGEKFPRFLSYNRDGDEYVLEFSEFVN